MVTLATLMYEILLTRIFSVTMWYHFAFVAISVGMFGMTVGAMLVYLLPGWFTEERAKRHLGIASLLFAVSILVSFLIHLVVPFVAEGFSAVVLFSYLLTYVVISLPFLFSGIAVCLALTKFPRQVSKLYAVDLAGAALGCILLIYVLTITDGPTAVILVAFLASLGAVLFAFDAASKRLKKIAITTSIALGLLAAANAVLVTTSNNSASNNSGSNNSGANNSAAIRLMWVKGRIEPPALYEEWNSFSRVVVQGNPDRPTMPFGWGWSPVAPPKQVRQLWMEIDASAGTPITGYDGDPNSLDFLRYDITNLAHYIRPNSNVLVIGTGGGRDVLSALAFRQKSVVGVEINGNVLNAVNKRFADFTGHLYKDPRVTFVNDEARSYVARQKNSYDIIQVSLIDTWAATAAGAFVLSENSLYTVEAWKIFLSHLNPRGVLTFSRWYFRDRPGEMYRLTSLASAALRESGVENPRDHIIIVRHMYWGGGGAGPDGVGTMIVSKDPFSSYDVESVKRVADQMKFEMVLDPIAHTDDTYVTLTSVKDLDAFTASYPINIAPPTDDSPFFFHMLRLKDVFRQDLWEQGKNNHNMKAVFLLGVLLIIVAVLTTVCIIIPLLVVTKRAELKGALPLSLFFAAIGLGFMLIEISQMQRLIIFLGHPTYGLSVVLFALLLSSGIGSYLTQWVKGEGDKNRAIAPFLALLLVLIIFGILTPYATAQFQSATTVTRILIAVIILFPLGLLMGMAFPLGMKVADRKARGLTPWLWGINGAMSVCASVLAVVISLSSSISTTFWVGTFCYAAAFFSFAIARRPGIDSI
jgi:hypothetical protein